MSGPEVDWSEVDEKAQLAIAEGYQSPEEIEENLLEQFELNSTEPNRARVRQTVRRALAEHEIEQQGWPAETDCDRLDRAFAALEAIGVVARQNFTCCNTCGRYEIRGEMAQEQSQGRQLIGYTFFHSQDTESAAAGGDLFLSYGPSSLTTTDESVLAVGRIVATTLRNAGFQVEWGENPARKIQVKMSWQRRRPAGQASVS